MARDVMSVRISVEIRDQLHREAARTGELPSTLAERLIDEGLRERRHPLIRFVSGPAGRRARLIPGPDVWELISFLQRSEAVGDEKISHAAEWFGLSSAQVEAAVTYYAAYPSEIDDRIRLNQEAQAEAEALAAGREQLLR
jgi:hypothetical protein